MYVHLNYSIRNLSLLFCSVATVDHILNKKISQDSLFEEGRHRNEQKRSFSFIRVEFFAPSLSYLLTQQILTPTPRD